MPHMARFFFPILFWSPDILEDQLAVGKFTLHKRKWEVSIFDLYTIAAQKPPIHFTAGLAEIFLGKVNCEISVEGKQIEEAQSELDVLRAMLYTEGLSPTIAPYSSNYSLNAYAGINGRSSSIRQKEMPEGLRKGITTADTHVDMYAYEVTFDCIGSQPEDLVKLDAKTFEDACNRAEIWKRIENHANHAKAARRAFVKSPLIPDLGSSLLQVWQGIVACCRFSGHPPKLTRPASRIQQG